MREEPSRLEDELNRVKEENSNLWERPASLERCGSLCSEAATEGIL